MPGPAGPHRLSFDPEWLGILRNTNPLLLPFTDLRPSVGLPFPTPSFGRPAIGATHAKDATPKAHPVIPTAEQITAIRERYASLVAEQSDTMDVKEDSGVAATSGSTKAAADAQTSQLPIPLAVPRTAAVHVPQVARAPPQTMGK